MIKTLLAAGIVRDYEFLSIDDLDIHLYSLDHRKISYKVLETFERPDGTVLVRILQQYNSSPLIQLYEGSEDD